MKLLKHLNIIFLIFSFNVQSSVWTFERMEEFTGYSSWEDKQAIFSAAQRKSIESYQASPILNKYLRQELPLNRSHRTQMRNLDRSMLKIKFPNDLILFRGVDLGYRNNEAYRLGEEFQDKAYTSTTINSKIASEIGKSVVYVLYSPKSFNALWIGGHRWGRYQEEILLPRDRKFKVMDSKIKDGKYIQLLQICEEICAEDISHPDVENIFSNF